jgi:putative ABC transport system permease protein
VITIVLVVFLILSSVLMAGGLRVTGTIVSSLKGLDRVAIPPDYMQMHKGTFEEDALNDFVKTHEYIEDFLIVQMLNIRNANIVYEGGKFENCLMDNGFVVQNERFDFLLNMENKKAVVQVGEVGVPVYYVEEFGIQVGDKIMLREGDYRKELTVSTIIRDSTMNSSLTYSKRFLINPSDLEDISNHMGEWEYLFEFLLEDGASTSVLEKDYIDAGMPKNGVAVTGSFLTMLNGVSYGLVAFMIIIISILLMIMAILCLSYIIRATMAEENITIGEMKAMGFPRKAIGKLYRLKYSMLVLIAGVIGYLVAIPFGEFGSSSAIRYCGEGDVTWMKWVFPLIGIVILSLIVVLRCRRTIYKNLKHTVMELMRGEEKIKKEGHYSLPRTGLKYRNLTVALGELKCKWKEYAVVFLIFVLSTFLIIIPINMKSTLEDPSFMTYMGIGKCDIRIDMQNNEKLEEQKNAAISYLKSDKEIKKYAIYQIGYVPFENSEGDTGYIRVTNGDETIFPLKYLTGNAPKNGQEIALSFKNASDMEKEIGDSLAVNYQGKETKFLVSGIYQDITYSGKTAKAAIAFDDKDVEAYAIYMEVNEGVSVEDKTKELRSALNETKVVPVNEFKSQTLGGIEDNMGLVEVAACVISLLLITLITVMFLQLITAREHSAIAIKKAIGFSNKDLRIQLGIRIFMIQFTAIIVGVMLSNFIGEAIFGSMLSTMGASKITMLANPLIAYLLCPAAELFVVFITVVLGTRIVRKYHIRDQIME